MFASWQFNTSQVNYLFCTRVIGENGKGSEYYKKNRINKLLYTQIASSEFLGTCYLKETGT